MRDAEVHFNDGGRGRGLLQQRAPLPGAAVVGEAEVGEEGGGGGGAACAHDPSVRAPIAGSRRRAAAPR